MSRGYVVLAQNTEKHDYLRMAYALALSIKNSQSTVNNISVITNETDIPEKYTQVFDKIIPIPWSDRAVRSEWKIENKWKYYYATPYDETVILDVDMIFPSDISHWWDVLSKKEIWIVDEPKTFKGNLITSTKFRKTFVSNNLPNVYTAFMYFKKDKLAGELFKLIDIIFNNWEHFFYTYLDETRPRNLSGDVAYALAIKLMGIESECFGNINSVPSFVHMKSHLQDINEKYMSDDWTKNIPTYFSSDGTFKIGNYQQAIPFHYQVKEWLTDDMISILERRIGV